MRASSKILVLSGGHVFISMRMVMGLHLKVGQERLVLRDRGGKGAEDLACSLVGWWALVAVCAFQCSALAEDQHAIQPLQMSVLEQDLGSHRFIGAKCSLRSQACLNGG